MFLFEKISSFKEVDLDQALQLFASKISTVFQNDPQHAANTIDDLIIIARKEGLPETTKSLIQASKISQKLRLQRLANDSNVHVDKYNPTTYISELYALIDTSVPEITLDVNKAVHFSSKIKQDIINIFAKGSIELFGGSEAMGGGYSLQLNAYAGTTPDLPDRIFINKIYGKSPEMSEISMKAAKVNDYAINAQVPQAEYASIFDWIVAKKKNVLIIATCAKREFPDKSIERKKELISTLNILASLGTVHENTATLAAKLKYTMLSSLAKLALRFMPKNIENLEWIDRSEIYLIDRVSGAVVPLQTEGKYVIMPDGVRTKHNFSRIETGKTASYLEYPLIIHEEVIGGLIYKISSTPLVLAGFTTNILPHIMDFWNVFESSIESKLYQLSMITETKRELGVVRTELQEKTKEKQEAELQRDQISSNYQNLQRMTTEYIHGAKHDAAHKFKELIEYTVTAVLEIQVAHQIAQKIQNLSDYINNLLIMFYTDANPVDLETFIDTTYLKNVYDAVLQEFRTSLISPEEYVEQLQQTADPAALNKKIQVEYRSDLPENVMLATYRFYLEGRVFNNLVGNSIKHGFKGMEEAVGKKIRIHITSIIQKNGRAYYHILYADNGHGIPKGRENDILNGWSSEAHLAADTEEHGLGGRNIKKYIELSNGEITTLSTSHPDFGQGACFEILLPVFMPPEEKSLISSNGPDATEAQWLPREYAYLQGTKILILDDDQHTQRAIGTVFGPDFQLFYAACLQEAQALLAAQPDIRLATVDVDLHGEEKGTTLIPELKKHDIKTIVISSHADTPSEMWQLMTRHKADRAFPKNFGKETNNIRDNILLLLAAKEQ